MRRFEGDLVGRYELFALVRPNGTFVGLYLTEAGARYELKTNPHCKVKRTALAWSDA